MCTLSCEEEQRAYNTGPSGPSGNSQRPFPQGMEIDPQEDHYCWVSSLRGEGGEGQLRGTDCTVPMVAVAPGM